MLPKDTKVKRVWRLPGTACLWASFILSSAQARADDSPMQKLHGSDREGAALESKSSAESSEQLAAVAYQKAVANYASGNVAAALDNMRESYQLSKRAELLYNLAQLEEELKACREAVADYGRYLELVPHGRYRQSAEVARDRLEPECPPLAPVVATNVAPPAEITTAVPEPKQGNTESAAIAYWTAPHIIGWTTIAAGVAAGASAIYFQLEAVQARNEFQQSVDNANAGGPPVDTSLQDRQHRDNQLAIGLGIASGAMIASGALVLLLGPGPEARSRSANFYALPGSVGGSFAQRF